ncbi:hypothetical protein ACYATP_02195 [Lactobacillaceae bacterium Melli_B4]
MQLKQLVVSLALATPLVIAPAVSSTTNVHAATTNQQNKSHNYELVDVKFYKHAKTYHAKHKLLTVQQAIFMADEPVVSFEPGKGTKLKTNAVKVDQKVVVKVSNQKLSKLLKDKHAYQSAKNATYYHIKKIGWVQAADLTK